MNAGPVSSTTKKLFDEVQVILAHPRAQEILSNDWLHDGELHVPSAEFMQYLAFRLLTGHGIKLTAATRTRDEIIAEVVDALRNESAEERLNSVCRVTERLKCYRLLHAAKEGTKNRFSHEWRGILWPFLYPSESSETNEATALAAGQRVLARGIIESMILRAVFHWDAARIDGMAAVLREIRDVRPPAATIENRAAGEIMRWLPWLSEKLGRHPWKSEMKAFILNVFPEVSDKPNSWSTAWGLVGYPRENNRQENPNEIIRLARLAAVEVLSV